MPAYRQPICHARYSISSRRWKAALLVTTAFCGFAIALPAPLIAQTAAQSNAGQYSFNIAPQSLSSAMVAFQSITGMSVLADSSVPQNVKSPGVAGSLTAENALAQMLAGTGLSYSISANTARIINPATDSSAATVDGAIALDTIDVSGGSSGSAAADEPYITPGSVSYVSAEQLERLPATTPGDMLRDVPGVDIRGGNNGAQMDVSIRGQHGNNRVKVKVEGSEIDSSTHQGYFGQDNSTFVDPDLISSITVDKGPSTGPNGGAIAGVVSMRTLMADDVLLPGRTVGIRVRGTLMGNVTDDVPNAGNHAFDFDRPALFNFAGRSGSIALAARTDTIEIVAAATEREHGNYFAGKNGAANYGATATQVYSRSAAGAEVLNTSQDSRSQLLKATVRPWEGHSVEAGYLRSANDFGWIYPISANGLAQAPLNWIQSERMWGRYNWNPAENDLVNFHANVWKAQLERTDQRFTTSKDAPGIVESWGTEVWNESRLDSVAGLFIATYGGEYSLEEADLEGGLRNNHASREVASTYANLKWKPLDWLTLDGGVRYTTFETWGGYQQGATFVEQGQDGSGITPSAGVTLEFLEGLQLFGKYTEGYRPPSIRETVPQAYSGYAVNPTLRPEQSRNFELGANLLTRDVLRADDALKLKLAYFNNRYEDYITIITPYDPDYYYHNIPGAKIDGIELSGSYSNGTLFAEANFNYYTTFEYCYPPHPWIVGPSINTGCTQYLGGGGLVYSISAPPKYSGSLTVGTKMLEDKLTVGATTRFFSKSVVPWQLPNGNFVFDAPMWRPDAIVDLFSSYKFSEHFEVSASIENVFDRYYVDPMSIAKQPAPGRTMRIGGTLRFDDQGGYGFDEISVPVMTTRSTGHDWSGAFAGLEGGYLATSASAEGDFTGTIRTGSNAANYVWNPYRSNLQTAHEAGNLSRGLFAGYNFQLNSPVVFGVDANAGYVAATDVSVGRFTTPAATPAITRTLTTTVTSNVDWQAGVRGRVGVAFDRMLPYIAGGLAVAQFNYNYASFSLNQTASTITLPNVTNFQGTYIGWTLGAGVEHAMTDHMLFRAEYRHNDFGKKTFDTPAGAHKVDLTSDEWKLGVAYKF
ncbi:TonB-dependent receptor [Hyphomicrobium sp. D-2]|uniref:TonB-dependent receptor domain-containing protein n=1 Tax=Hyphomicrobium sp. D-2 TaxID=3041621 RepID=UPI0024557C70|nr:TonB-dependent receptor [Hyphomicrobium sp. D-2]MDH4983583.1 TonB-dependent receptor [Hyphomicrobium sp. D-2]